jgi:cation-transporting ATPase 13A1
MSPQGKANVIRAMQQQQQACVFMCGDGGNDVGALKQADVGMALLSGYGNLNAGDSSSSGSNDSSDGKSAEEQLNAQQAQLQKRAAASQKAMKEEMKKVQAELQAKQKERMMTEVQRRIDQGEAGIWTTINVMKETMGEFKAELVQRQREIAQKHGSVYDNKDKKVQLLKEEMESEMAGVVVRPGDASVAAPFTSRAPSVANMVDVVRQGRCTLLSALQNQQIMMLECIITAYTLSALSLEGARSSDRQMMATGWLLSIASMAFAFATTIDKMSKTRPLHSLFHKAVFFSMLGQAAIHLGCMVMAVQLATEEMGPAGLKEVADFHKEQKMIRLGQLCKDKSIPMKMNATDTGCPPDPDYENDWMALAMSMLNQPFLPNLLNTVVWLVETSQMCAVTFVNYKGRPWMKGIMENHALFLSSIGCIGLVAFGAWEVIPEANRLLHLAPFPNEDFRWKVMGLVFMSLGGTLIWDRICIALFAPEIMAAMIDNAKATTWEDIMSLLTTLGKVVGCLAVYLTGNPIIWIGAIWYYRKMKRETAEREAAAAAAQ